MYVRWWSSSSSSIIMTPERAATLLKIPVKKRNSEVVVARKELEERFLLSVHSRYCVDARASDYGERVAQRHIYEGRAFQQ